MGVIDAPIGRVSDSVILRAVRPDGRRAVTHFERLDYRNGCSLARVWLDTGRTHQIRVQFASRGMPLAGDGKYGGGGGGMALWSWTLEFPHPNGKPMAFRALPEGEVWIRFAGELSSLK